MNQRPRVLMELGVELDRAARNATSRRQRRRWVPIPPLSKVVAFLAVGCTLAVAGFAIVALGHRGPSSPTATGKHGASTPARHAAGDLQASFAALRRPRMAADRLPSQVRYSIAHRPLVSGMKTGLSRRVIATRDMEMWLVPARRELCDVVINHGPGGPTNSGYGIGCISTAGAKKYGLVAFGKTMVSGVLPDDSSDIKVTFKDGSSALLAPDANGAIVYKTKRSIRDISYTSPAGAPIKHSVLPPRSNPIIKDCLAHGQLTHSYTTNQLRQALAVMPPATKKYTNCSYLINHALLRR